MRLLCGQRDFANTTTSCSAIRRSIVPSVVSVLRGACRRALVGRTRRPALPARRGADGALVWGSARAPGRVEEPSPMRTTGACCAAGSEGRRAALCERSATLRASRDARGTGWGVGCPLGVGLDVLSRRGAADACWGTRRPSPRRVVPIPRVVDLFSATVFDPALFAIPRPGSCFSGSSSVSDCQRYSNDNTRHTISEQEIHVPELEMKPRLCKLKVAARRIPRPGCFRLPPSSAWVWTRVER